MAIGGLSVGTAFVDILPNTGKFGGALQSQLATQTSKQTSGITKFGEGAALALTAAGAASIKLAADFDASMRNVNSIAQLPERSFQSLSQSVLDLAGPTAQAPKTLADGLYDLVSSGFDAKESLKILEASAYAATAGLTTTDVSVKGVAAVLNAYRLPASKAQQVSDTLFRTVDRGVITFEALSGGIGDTLPFAAALNVSLAEVGSATATMTKQGIPASETFTRIRNLMQTLIKPGEGLADAYKKLDVAGGEALIKQEGFQGALEALAGTTDGSKEALTKLFPNIRALGGALALTGENTKAANADLKEFGNVAGATQRALSEQAKSTSFQFHQFSAQLQAVAIEFGRQLLPVVNQVLHALSAMTPVLRIVGTVARVIATGLGAVFQAQTKVVVAAIRFIIDKGRPVFQALRSVAVTVAAAISAAFQKVRTVAIAVWNAIRSAARPVFSAIGDFVIAMRDRLAPIWAQMKVVGKAVWDVIKAAANAARDWINKVGDSVKSILDSQVFQRVKEAGQTAFDAVKGAISAALGAVEDLISGVQSLKDLLDSLKGSGPGLPGLSVTGGRLPGTGKTGSNFDLGPAVGAEVAANAGRILPELGLKTSPATAGVGRERWALTITNWKTGEGHMRRIAGGEDAALAALDVQLDRMGA